MFDKGLELELSKETFWQFENNHKYLHQNIPWNKMICMFFFVINCISVNQREHFGITIAPITLNEIKINIKDA